MHAMVLVGRGFVSPSESFLHYGAIDLVPVALDPDLKPLDSKAEPEALPRRQLCREFLTSKLKPLKL